MSASASPPASSASAMWLLEAKSYLPDDRSEAAGSVRYWLKPGGYAVGKPRHSEVEIDEDKSISRKHGDLAVPPTAEREAGAPPYVLLTDRSKYGTVISRSGSFTDEVKLEGGAETRVQAGWMLRFGFKSPFKLVLQDWVLYLSPDQRERAGAGELAALEEAAAATGLPLTDKLPDHPGTRVLALGAAPLRVDGPLLLALLRGYPVVGANWLLEWQQQRVWRNSRPQEAAFPVQLQYSHGSSGGGRLKALPGPAALLAARAAQPLAGHTLLWLPPARDASLAEAAENLGASNHDVAASGRAPAAAKAAGAVLVRGSATDTVPAAYRRLPWTTPELLIAAMLENSLDAALHQPGAEGGPDTTPPSAGRKGRGRGGKAAPGSRSTSGGKKGKGRGKAAAVEEDGAAHESGSETDVSEDASHLAHGATQRTLAVSKKQPAAAPAAVEDQQQQQQQQQEEEHEDPDAPPADGRRGKKVAAQLPAEAAAAPEPSAAKVAAGGRKRRHEQREQQQEEGVAAVQAARPTPAKKQRRQAEQPPAAAEVEKVAELKVPTVMPAEAGWLNRGAGHPQPQHPGEDASPQGRTPAGAATSAEVVAASASKQRGARRPGKEAAATVAAPEAEAGEEEEEEEQEDGETRITFVRMVVPHRPPPAAPSSGGADGGHNFKAFRKGGGGGAAAAPGAALARPLVTYELQPYMEEGPVNADKFLKAEADRRRRAAQADELFSANIKAKKAAHLPDPDEDSPPAKGRGRGGKKAAAPAAGQKSILGFLPTGPGRGRGRGAGRGAGRGRK